MADDLQPALDLYPDGEEPLPAPKKPEPLWIRTPGEHGELVHGGGKGLISIARKTSKDNWKEKVHSVEAGLQMLKCCSDQENVYLSTQRFRGWRRVAYLLSLSELYADLDYYKIPELSGADPRRVLELARKTLRAASKPEPSLAISSGRGLYLLWLHDPLPRSALPRWTACQRELHETLKPLGADPMATDAARVLRVVGTRHPGAGAGAGSGAGAIVEAITPAGEAWDFNRLADQVLSLSRAELYDLRVQRALRGGRKPTERPQAPPEGFTAATLWEARLADLQRLRTEIRWFGDLPPGQRDHWMFIAGAAMSWLAVPGQPLRRELYALAHEAASWSEREAKSRLQAIFRTAHEAQAGKKVQWQGLEVDPRYRMKNQTIIEALEITAEEERRMKTIISDDERRRRERERDESRRRESGEMTRAEYEGRADQRRTEANRMASEGMSTGEIAETLEVSVKSVRSYLSSEKMTRKEYRTRAARRRVQIRRLAAEGLSTREIAEKLGVSKDTVWRTLKNT